MTYNDIKSLVMQLINQFFKIFLVFVPTKFLRAKLKADWTKLYIKKYVIIASKNCDCMRTYDKDENPPFFQYWEQGIENAPDIIKACTNSIDKFEPNARHIVLNSKTIEDYINIPSFIYDLKNKGKIKCPQFSDIIRSFLLAQYPCVWVDSTLFFTDKLPPYIKENDFFVFKGDRDKPTPEKFACANFFIYSKMPNSILIQVKDAIVEYWKDNNFLISYFTHPHFLSLVAKVDEENKKLFDKIPYYSERLTLQIGKSLFTEYDERQFNIIKSKSSIHKCTYKIPKTLDCDIKDTLYYKIIKGYLNG